ncbi:MAG: hypothetical protein IKN27_08220 [Selenomonadaceae bacterium]|nr:hypothetical protein [Selenomonadaceae bacterium]
MKRPTITIDGKTHEMNSICGREYRIVSEYRQNSFSFDNTALIEEAASFIANFFDSVTAEQILDLPLEEIMPLAFKIQNCILQLAAGKAEEISKNSDEDKTSR